MTAALPSDWRGRVLALAIAALPLFFLWFAVVAPLADWYAGRADRLVQRIRVLQRMEQVAAGLPALKARASETVDAASPALRTLDGASDALAAAALQNRLQDMVSSAGAILTSVEILEAGAAGDYRRIGLKLSLSASWPVLVQVLQAVEQSPLPMVVDGMQIRAASSRANEAKLLDTSFTVAAFRLAAPVVRTQGKTP
jgi:general secretion pathway protein M